MKQKKLQLNDILRQNPNIDQKLLKKAQREATELKKAGLGGATYNLEIPFSRCVQLNDAAS
ncbi:MAG: hypothetical protein OEY01_15835 [Desulfobulbaceae bacterium]|nr:hypothetical protein [Desulfobulbaceae bacterium]